MTSPNSHQQEKSPTSFDDEPSQLTLFKQRRFLPFFLTQFLGAFNDNVFKNSLVLLITYGTLVNASDNLSLYTNSAALLFILPFFLFSATAGQLADKYEKSFLIRQIKALEIAIMLAASLAFYFESIVALMIVLFLMGTQSSFFGPVKYSIIPQHLKEDELVGGNALVEAGTFLAILLGTILAGVLRQFDHSLFYVSSAVLIFAVLGYLASRSIPKAEAADPQLKINWNIITQTQLSIRFAREKESVFLSIMGISWFWFLGASYLTQLPEFSKTLLGGNDGVVILLLTVFSIGIGSGSLLCERLSGHKVELGLVPLGSLGLSIFGIDLSLLDLPPATKELRTITEFLALPGSFRLIIDIMGIGMFGGFYIVPLYAMVQERTDPTIRSRVIAGNNILNALLMVVSAITGFLLLGIAKLSIPQFFLTIAVMNIVVALFIYKKIPEFTMRFLIWILTHTMYRVRHINMNHIPADGPAVLVCNHVSYVDALLIGGACHRPIRFVMYKPIYDLPVLNFIFRTGKAIPITSRKVDQETYDNAFNQISAELKDNEIVCIFPEGKLTTDGEVDIFKNGIEKIIERDPVPVIPMALCGLWGSFFSHQKGHAMMKLPSRFWSKVDLQIGDAISPTEVTAQALREEVLKLRGSHR